MQNRNMQGCREYWRGYSAGKAAVLEHGLDLALDRYYFGYCGNGSWNYSNGFFAALCKAAIKRDKRASEKGPSHA